MDYLGENQMQKDEQEQRSEIRRRRVRDFFYHLVVYLFVLALIFLVSGVSGALVWLFLFCCVYVWSTWGAPLAD